jgi:Arc/MetJ-type ribon-helix-helix transcriptional regulator
MGAPITLRFPDEMLEDIDAITASRMDHPDRSAVIRELVAEALVARKARKSR